MIYSPSTTAALGIVEDAQPEEPLTLRGEGLWVCLISSGKCVVSLSDLELMPAGSALLLPPQNAAAGHLVLSRGPLTLAPENECHLLCVQLTGAGSGTVPCGAFRDAFPRPGRDLPGGGRVDGAPCRRAGRLGAGAQSAGLRAAVRALRRRQRRPCPAPLVAAAIEDIRRNYAGLYGVEELSERLGVSKSHLVRAFTAALGVSPGRYLTSVRIEAAMRLLLHREYTLDVIASLCGFSGANYLCRVFKKTTGQSPTQWRAMAGRSALPELSPEQQRLEQELFI